MVRTEAGARAQPRSLKILRNLALPALLGLAFVATGTQAADDPILKKLAGDWTGTGTFRFDSTSDAEALWCHVAGSVGSDGVLHQSGRCALPDQAISFKIDLQPTGGGRYAGTASGVAGIAKAPAISGAAKGNQVLLTAADGDGPPMTTTLDLTAGGFRMQAVRVDPKTGKKYSASDVTFGPS